MEADLKRAISDVVLRMIAAPMVNFNMTSLMGVSKINSTYLLPAEQGSNFLVGWHVSEDQKPRLLRLPSAMAGAYC